MPEDRQPNLRGRAREALLEAAVACVREHGVAGTTQAEILVRSGANARSIAYHYGSKDQLVTQGVLTLFARRAQPILQDAASRDGASARERLEAMFAAGLGSVLADRDVAIGLPEAVAQSRNDEIRVVLAEHYRAMRGQLEEVALAAFGDRLAAAGGSPAVLASALLALIDGLVLQWLVDPDTVPDAEELVQSLTAAVALADHRTGAPGRDARRGA